MHARNLRAREPGGPTLARPADRGPGRSGKAEAARPRRTRWGVVLLRSTCEATEQERARRGRVYPSGGGGGGGKGAGQGERGRRGTHRTLRRTMGVNSLAGTVRVES